MARRACTFSKKDGGPCRAPPLHDSEFCFAHDPAYANEVAEARRLGGRRRKRERAVVAAFDLDDLDSVDGLRRLLSIAMVDVLSLENTTTRARILIAIVGAGAKLLEVGDFQQRLQAVEQTLREARVNGSAQPA